MMPNNTKATMGGGDDDGGPNYKDQMRQMRPAGDQHQIAPPSPLINKPSSSISFSDAATTTLLPLAGATPVTDSQINEELVQLGQRNWQLQEELHAANLQLQQEQQYRRLQRQQIPLDPFPPDPPAPSAPDPPTATPDPSETPVTTTPPPPQSTSKSPVQSSAPPVQSSAPAPPPSLSFSLSKTHYMGSTIIIVILILVLAMVAGVCGTGNCSGGRAVASPPTATTAEATHHRADPIRTYINDITLSGQILRYPPSSYSSAAEEFALKWLIEDDLITAVDDERSLRQRFVLATLTGGGIMMANDDSNNAAAATTTTWTTDADECTWSGVECDAFGRVTVLGGLGQLRRRSNVPGSPIPNDLGLLTHLTDLSLQNNKWIGTIPPSLGNLTALNKLSLDGNQLSGTIPSSLAALSSLGRLLLYGNQLSGTIPPSLFDTLFDLTELSLDGNQLNGTIPSSLAALTALTGLSMSDNRLTGTIPSSLAALTDLNVLQLQDNMLNGTIPASLGAFLTDLVVLWLYGNNELVGTVPFCNHPSDRKKNLVADCAHVNCTCCTGCCPAAFGDIPVHDECP